MREAPKEKPVGDRLFCSVPACTSVHASDVIGQRLDFEIVELGSDPGHLCAVLSHAPAEGSELRFGVLGVLATHAWVQGGNAGASRAVTAGTRWDASFGNAPAVDLLAKRDQLWLLGKARLGTLGGIEGGHVAHVLFAQRGGEALHDRVCPLARLELDELLDKVLGVLPLQDRLGRAAPRSINAVARSAHRSRCGALGEVRLGRCRRLVRLRGKRSQRSQNTEQQSSRKLHVEVPKKHLKTGILQFEDLVDGMTEHSIDVPADKLIAAQTRQALAWTHTARFLTTASQLRELPQTELPEIAFVGRSNAGKSTAINTLAQQKRLAFASKTPGRTQHINLFEVGPKMAPDALFADLPGYGYAAVARDAKLRWQQVMADYLEVRRSLSGLVLMVDSRLGFTDLDRQLLSFVAPRLGNGCVRLLVLLTKSDKLNRSEATAALASAQQVLGEITTEQADVSVAPFSALKKSGVEEAAMLLYAWAHRP